MTIRQILFWALFAATVAVYVPLLFYAGPKLSGLAGGLPPFDIRITGYNLEEARAFLTALTPEGLALYTGPVSQLDLVFPALFASSMVVATYQMLLGSSLGVRLVLSASPLFYAAFDYLENSIIKTMLALGPDRITTNVVEIASGCTIMKYLAAGISIVTLSVLLVMHLRRRFA